MQWLVRCTLIWYWRKHLYFKCQLLELDPMDTHGVQRTDTEYIVKCVERVLSYNLQHTVDPAQSLREPLLCVCVCVSMGPATAGTYYLLRSAAWSRSRQLLSNHCPLPCHPATPFDTFYHRRSLAVRKRGQFNSPPPILWENCFNIKTPKTKTVIIGTALIR